LRAKLGYCGEPQLRPVRVNDERERILPENRKPELRLINARAISISETGMKAISGASLSRPEVYDLARLCSPASSRRRLAPTMVQVLVFVASEKLQVQDGVRYTLVATRK
jgi:hypothetical protein